MACDEDLAERVRARIAGRDGFSERRMFGGVAFMLHGHMCCGISGDALIARVDQGEAAALLERDHVRPFDMTGRPMRGWLFVEAEAVADDAGLDEWVERCVAFVGTLPPR